MKQILDKSVCITDQEYVRLRVTIKNHLLTFFDEIVKMRDNDFNVELISFVGVKYYPDKTIKWMAVSVFFASEYYDYLTDGSLDQKITKRLETLNRRYDFLFDKNKHN